MALNVIMCLLVLPIGIVSLELQGNYRFWDSVSNQIVYDYSGKNHHGFLTGSYFFTDRGLTTNSLASFLVETSFYASNTQEAVLSFWINCPDSETSVSIKSTTTSLSVKGVYNQKVKPFATVLNLGTNIFSQPVQVYKEWNLYTALFNYTSNTQIWYVKLYINLQLAYSTIIGFYPFTINQLSVDLNLSKSLKNIVYEFWWHTGLSSISDLSNLISTKGNPTSPKEIDLPPHNNKKNFAGKDCSTICPSSSCDNNLKCITFPNTSCSYGLYQILTFDCLFFCPDNSCIFSTTSMEEISSLETLACGCKAGYNKVSTNPPACISSFCTSYSMEGYRYICTACDSRYILDPTTNSCICREDTIYQICIPNCVLYDGNVCSICSDNYKLDSNKLCKECNTGYVLVSETPFTCVIGIPNCISYTTSGYESICKQCLAGYSLDPYNHCNLCDTGYTIYKTTPFTCIKEIENCITYDNINSIEYPCRECRYGYIRGCNNKCCECDTSIDFIEVSKDPIICIASISHYIQYLKYDIDWGCSTCNTGYTLDSLHRCDACAEGYLEIWDPDFKCIGMIEGCVDYGYDPSNDRYICIECEEGLLLYDGECEECSVGYYVSKIDPIACIKCPERCESCKETQGELKCTSCEYGYIILSNLCECDSKEFYLEGSICNPIPLRVAVSSITNILSLSFNKPLANQLSQSDITINLPNEIEVAYLSYEIIIVQDYEEYDISLSFSMNIDMIIDITIIFLDSVKDRQNQSLSDNTHITQLHLQVSNFIDEIICDISCKECELKQNNIECTSCYDYAYISSGICKCYIEESEELGSNCPARCPENMIFNTQSRICENINKPSESEPAEDSPDSPNTTTTQVQAPAQTKGIVAACVSVSVISLNLNNVLSIIGTIQILSYILLYNLPLPSDIEEILKGLSILEFHPNIFEYLFSYSDTLVEYRYTRMDYTSEIILINSGKSLSILLYMLSLYLIFRLLDKCITANSVLKRLVFKVLDSLRWNMIIGYLFSIYLELVVTSLINIKYADYSDKPSIIGFIISMIILVISI